MLGSKHRAVKINEGSNFIIGSRQSCHFDPFLFIIKRNIGVYCIPGFGSVLFNYPGFFNDLHEWLTAAIDDWDLRAIQFNKAVINTHTNQCCKHMFHGAYLCIALFKGSATGCVSNKVTISLNNRTSGKVFALELKSKAGV